VAILSPSQRLAPQYSQVVCPGGWEG